MALVLKDRVKETTITAGTGTVTLAGAVAGFQSFAAVGNGNETFYAIVDVVSGAWEVGVGTYTASGTTLSRTTVVSSSNAGSLVNFPAGIKDVFVTYPSSRAVYLNAAGSAVSALDIGTLGASTANITTANITAGTITTPPVNNTDIVNKQYADAIATGIHFHEAVDLATTAALPANTYNNGTSGVGATLTGNANGALSVDSTLTVVANRILVKNEANGSRNGVYVVTQVGSAGTPYILTRSTDMDSVGTGVDQIDEGDFFLVTSGTANVNTAWVQQTPPPITIGTTAIVFQQFSAPITYTAGTGLSESPSYTFNITNIGTAGTYGSASSVPVITTNAQGQVTGVTPTAIAISGSAVTGNITGQAGSVANALTAGSFLTSGGTYNGSAARTFAVDATDANTASKVVARDASGNFSAGTITATLSGAATSATTATNLAGGAANRIAYQTGAGATAFAVAPSASNQVLNWNGSAFTWSAGTISGIPLGSNLNTLTFGTFLTGTSYNGSAAVTIATNATSANTVSTLVARDASGNFSAGTITAALNGNASTATSATSATSATTATNLAGGSVGTIPYQSAANTTVQLAAGTSGQLLQSNGAAAPSWVAAPVVNNGTLTMNVSGTGLSGSQTFTANQAGAATFTVTSNATNANTASTIVARDASGNFSAGTITAALSGNASTATSATSATTATNLAGGGAGTIPYQSAANTTVQLAAGTSGQLLQSNGAAAPSWVAAPAAANNGTLTMNVSGTGLSGSQTFTANQAGNATFTVTSNATNANTASTIVARDASGNFSAGTITATLSGNASTATTATSATSATSATTATNLAGGGAGTVPYQSAANTTVQLAAGTSGQVLRSNGAAAPSWVNGTISGIALGNNLNTLTMNVSGTGLSGSNTYNGSGAATFTVTSNATNANTASTIVARDASGNFSAGTITATLSGAATSATTATNLAGGSAGTIPYQSAANTTVQLAAGTAGQLLQSNGAAAPSWVAAPYSGATWRRIATATLTTTNDITIPTVTAPLWVEFESVNTQGSAARTPSVAFRQQGTTTFWSFPSILVASSGTTTTTTTFGSGTMTSGGTTPLTPSIAAGNASILLSLYLYPNSSGESPRVMWTATYAGNATSFNPTQVSGSATAGMLSQTAFIFDLLRFTTFIPAGGSGFGNIRVYQLT